MEQQREPLRSPASASFGGFLQACSWGWGIIALVIGLVGIMTAPLYGAVTIMLGALLLPPVRRLIGRMVGIRLAAPVALMLAMLILGGMIVIGRDLAASAMTEKRKQAAIEKERMRQENALIASYPYVDRDSLRAWRRSAADSTTDPDLTLASFLRRQEEFHGRHMADSIARGKQQREDSIARVKQWSRDSIASAKSHRSDSIEAARGARSAAVEQQRTIRQAESATETYNGHVIYTGPRGGRYYINSNGNKTYIR